MIVADRVPIGDAAPGDQPGRAHAGRAHRVRCIGMADLWLLQVSDTEPLYRVLRLDRDSGGVVAAIDLRDPAPLQGDGAQITFGAGAVWVAAGHRYLYRLDPACNRLAAVVDVGYHLDG